MATLSLRMRDDLKEKAQRLAREQGVSLNAYITATLAATVAQQETLAMFTDRLQGVDRQALHQEVIEFMSNAEAGDEPTAEEIQRAIDE